MPALLTPLKIHVLFDKLDRESVKSTGFRSPSTFALWCSKDAM